MFGHFFFVCQRQTEFLGEPPALNKKINACIVVYRSPFSDAPDSTEQFASGTPLTLAFVLSRRYRSRRANGNQSD